jgi:16S rRNA U1498 N3-methylase RsmE
MDYPLVESVIQTGFSIGVAAFLLIRMERELAALRKSIDRLARCQVCKLGDIDEPRT